ncbi:acyl-ACP--UDP-N-acetylglucosamine O-acyltransferase, partial [Gemmatimonadota bacterium]
EADLVYTHEEHDQVFGVEIGPFAYVEQDVVLGDRVRIGPHAHVAAGARLAEEVVVFTGAAVGNIPQDLKFDGETSLLEVGPRTIIREYCTLHRGTVESGTTVIGADCLLMAYVHIAHDCVVGDNCILANAVQVGGHVVLGNHVIIGGSTPVHQFCHIGDHAMVGGGFRVVQDVPPFVVAAGEPLKPAGVNSIGLQRRGFTEEQIRNLKKAYRLLFRSGMNRTNALERIGEELPATPEIETLVSFIERSERGLIG